MDTKVLLETVQEDEPQIVANDDMGCPPSQDNVEQQGRERWASHSEFLLASIGFAIGIGNVWRFPFLCYQYGGGTFLVPYLVALFGLAVPVFTFEMIVGQTFQLGTYHALKKINHRIRGVGVASSMVVAYVAIYYNVLLSWIIYYFFNSMRKEIPWAEHSIIPHNGSHLAAESYWFNQVLHKTIKPYSFGSVVWPLAAILLFSWFIVYVSLRRGLAVSGKLLYFTAIFPLIILVAFAFMAVNLEGSEEGLRFYLEPDWVKLRDVNVWHVAAQQVFYSLGPGFGTVISLASYNDPKYNAVRDSVFVGLINSFASIVAGFAVFGTLGHLAFLRGIPVHDIVQAGQGLVFIALPQALSSLAGVPLWAQKFCGALFFLMLFFLGIDTQFANIETLITLIKDLGSNWKHKNIVFSLCLTGFLMGLPLVTQGGLYWFDLIDTNAALFMLFVVVLFELIATQLFYGVDQLCDNYTRQSGLKIGYWMKFCWKVISPLYAGFLLVLTIVARVEEKPNLPPYARAIGLLVAASPLVPIILCAMFDDLTFKSHAKEFVHFMEHEVETIKHTGGALPKAVLGKQKLKESKSIAEQHDIHDAGPQQPKIIPVEDLSTV